MDHYSVNRTKAPTGLTRAKKILMKRASAILKPNFIFFWYILLSSLFFSLFALISNVSAQAIQSSFNYDAALEEFRQNEGSEIENPEAWNAFLHYKRNQSAQKYMPTQALSTEHPSTKPMSSCGNIDFETGDFSGWTGYTGFTPKMGTCCNTPGIISNGTNAAPSSSARHTIVTGNGVDPCGGFPVVAPALPGQNQGNYSVRLGNQNVGYEAERFTTNFTPTPSNNIFTYQYAVVIQDPSNPHEQGEKPYFEIAMFDQNGDTIPCTYYFVSANEGIPGFVNSTSCSQAIYKPWTTVSVDLSAYVNTPVDIRFSTGDCDKGGHFGYAYFNCECVNLKIVGEDTICEGETSTLIAPQEDNNTYVWSGPNGFTANTQSVNVTEAGNYSVMMTSITGCVKQLFYDVTVLPKPQTDFTNPTICSLTVPFTNNSNISSGNVNSWSWDFGDGNTSSSENPTHTYSSAGIYNVNLSIVSDGGCTHNISKTITTKSPPVVNFTPVEVCLDEAIKFQDQSTISGDVINTWKWDFGDGTISSEQNPEYTYGSEGTFNVELVVSSSSGCSDSTTLPVKVFPLPAPKFTAPDVCLNEFTDFSDQSGISSGTINQWSWDFGNGNSSKDQHPTFLFNTVGKHLVTLSTTSSKGCVGSTMVSVEIFPLPLATFITAPTCLNNASLFMDNSSISGGSISSWEWNFGESSAGSSNTSNQQNPSHTYSKDGSFDVTLISKSDKGCADTVHLPVVVHPIPMVDFASNEPCLGDTSDFINKSSINNGKIAAYSWNFGETSSGQNNLSTDEHPIHIYNSSGTFRVILTATSDNGCQSSFSYDATVKNMPQAAFTAPDVCLNEKTKFSDSSYVTTSGAVKSWWWDFGDGNISKKQNPEYTFLTDGTHRVSLTVKTDPTCVSTISKTINIFPVPTANFSIDPVKGSVMDPVIQFSDLSIDATSGIWDFGDGNSMPYVPGENPKHQFPDKNVPGGLAFDIRLDVINAFGCPSAIVKPLELDPYWTLFIPDAFTPNNDMLNDTFYAKGFGIQHFEMEIFDRWGNLVFQCEVDGTPQELPCQWDGIVQNGESNLVAQQDVFVYKVRFTDIFDQKHTRKGHVSMIR